MKNKSNCKTQHVKLLPFCLPEHGWIRHEWLQEFPADAILNNNGPGKLSLVRIGGKRTSLPEPTEARKAIEQWSTARHQEEADRFFSNGAATANLFARARVSVDATNCLNISAGQLFEMLSELAKEGNPRAVESLVSLTRKGCVVLKHLAQSQPNVLRPVARKSWKWPVLKSLHPHLSDDHELLLKNLQLGDDTPYEIHPSARWVTDEASNIAFSLLAYLWRHQKPRRKKNVDVGPIGKLVDDLPEFTSDTAPRWWNVAEKVFLFAYPKPELVEELSSLVTAPSHRKSPGVLHFRIREVLRVRFEKLARP